MKKQKTRSLKELEKSLVILKDSEIQKCIMGGGDTTYGNLLPEVTVTPSSSMLPAVNVSGTSTLSALNSSSGVIPNYPPNSDMIGGLTPTQQYSAACAKGYTQAANGLLIVSGCIVYMATSIYLSLQIPDTGSFIISPDNFGANSGGGLSYGQNSGIYKYMME